MATTFTTTQSGASADYLKYVYNGIAKTDRVNDPDLCDFYLHGWDGAFVKLSRGAYITISTDTYGVWFTGYITNDPELEFLGTKNVAGVTTPVWGFRYEATSDDYILNLKPLGILPPFINTTQGEILRTLVQLLAPQVGFNIAGVQDGVSVARYVVDPDKHFSDVVKDFADASYYRFTAKQKALTFAPMDATAATIAVDGNSKHFTPSRLSINSNNEPVVNDVIVLGDIEPQNFIHEYFVGDGEEAIFPAVSSVFGVDRTVLLDDDFGASSIDTAKWTLNDTLNYIQPFNGFLNFTGGPRTTPPVWLESANLIPLEGNVRLTHGEWDFIQPTTLNELAGSICGLWTSTPNNTFSGLAYGIQVWKNGDTTTSLNPIANGTVDSSQQIVVSYTKRYIIRSLISHSQAIRQCAQYSYLTSNGAVASITGASVPDTATVQTTITEIDPTNAAITHQWQWTNTVILSSAQTYALYTPGVSFDIHATVTGITISTPMQVKLEIAKAVRGLKNLAFDTWSGGLPVSWVSTGSVSQESTDVQAGSALKLTGNGVGTFSVVTQTFPSAWQANTAYRVYIRAKRSAGFVSGNLTVDLLSVSGSIDTTGLVIAASTLTTTYQTYTGLITTGLASIPSDLQIRVFIDTNPTSAEFVLVDDVIPVQEWQTQIIGPNELDSFDGNAPVATITDANTGTTTRSSLLGSSQYNPGQASLQFFKDSVRQITNVPQVGDLLHLSYRRAGAAIGRVQNATSIASEAIVWGDDGIRSLTKKDLTPKPRTSLECEAAAYAVLSDAGYQHFEGSYTMPSGSWFSGEPVAGSVLHFSNLPASFPSGLSAEMITEVKSTLMHANGGERFDHTINFGKPDLTRQFLSQLPNLTDVFAPQDTAEIPVAVPLTSVQAGNAYAADVAAPSLVGWDANNLYYKTNRLAPNTNLLLFTEQFDNTVWGLSANGVANPVVTANFTTDPQGGSTADKIVFPATGASQFSQIIQNAPSPGVDVRGRQVTFSIWLRADIATTITFQVADNPFTTISAFTSVNVSTSWQRLSVTAIVPSSANTGFSAGLQNSPSQAGKTIYAWGAQLEVSSAPLTYVPQTSTVTPAGGFEVRYTDESWGGDDGRNLLLRTSSQAFSVPRNNRTKIVFIKARDARNNCQWSEDFTHWIQGTNTSTVNVTDVNPDGDKSLISKVAFGTGSASVVTLVTSAPAFVGLQVSYTVWVKAVAPGDVGKVVQFECGGAGNWPNGGIATSTTLTSQWQKVTLSGTLTTGVSGNLEITVTRFNLSDTANVFVTRASLETGTLTSTVYCKTNGTAYGAVSRFASCVHAALPLVPPAATGSWDWGTDPRTIRFNIVLPTDLNDVWGVELRAGDDSGVYYHKDLNAADFSTTFVLDNSVSQFTSVAFIVRTYNILGEYSTGTLVSSTIPGGYWTFGGGVASGVKLGGDSGLAVFGSSGNLGFGATPGTGIEIFKTDVRATGGATTKMRIKNTATGGREWSVGSF
jgi:hypothetical protein